MLFDRTLDYTNFQTFTSRLPERSAPGKSVHDDNLFYFFNLKCNSYGGQQFSEEIDSVFFYNTLCSTDKSRISMINLN